MRTVVKSWSDKKYRYLRYVGPENASCNVAEIAFYEPNDTTALKGNVLELPGAASKMEVMYTPMLLMAKHGHPLIISSQPEGGLV